MNKSAFLLFLLFIPILAQAQKNEVILSAMQDEMKRSMEELRLDDTLAPFFISYGFSDQLTRSASATMGAFGGFNSTPARTINARLMVGNYDLNDESFQSETEVEGSFENDIVPLENDYLALRRTFWHSTDNIFRRASKYYKEHLKFIEKSKLPLDSLPHYWFAKSEPVVYEKFSEAKPLSDQQIKDYCVELSRIFIPYRNLKSSFVTLRESALTEYLINTEGTQVITGAKHLILSLRADLLLPDGKPKFDQLNYTGETLSDLPAKDKIESDLKALIARLMNDSIGIELEEDYRGPILFLDKSTNVIFTAAIANDYEAALPDAPNREKKGATYETNVEEMEDRLGEEVLPTHITIKLKPCQTHFEEKKLVGSYWVDAEGVKAPSELVLVDQGILKAVMTTRSLSNKNQVPNGTSSGPGVIEVTSTNILSEEKLKKELFRLAKKEGLKFAVIARKTVPGSGSIDLFHVSLKTGVETLITNGTISNYSDMDLDNLVAVGDQLDAYNHFVYSGYGSTSVIAPSSALLSTTFISKSKYTYKPEKPIVSSPLSE